MSKKAVNYFSKTWYTSSGGWCCRWGQVALLWVQYLGIISSRLWTSTTSACDSRCHTATLFPSTIRLPPRRRRDHAVSLRRRWTDWRRSYVSLQLSCARSDTLARCSVIESEFSFRLKLVSYLHGWLNGLLAVNRQRSTYLIALAALCDFALYKCT